MIYVKHVWSEARDVRAASELGVKNKYRLNQFCVADKDGFVELDIAENLVANWRVTEKQLHGNEIWWEYGLYEEEFGQEYYEQEKLSYE